MNQALEKAIGYHRSGKLSQAQAIYQRIVQKDKTNADAWHLLGVLFYQMGQLDIAEHNILKAIGLNPNVASFYSNLGLVCHQKREYKKAVDHYRKALAFLPEYPEALNNLGNALKELGFKHSPEHREALACYQKALSLSPNYPDALNNLATLLVLNGRADEAIPCYEASIRLNPAYADAYGNLGLIYKNKEAFEKASMYLLKALSLPGQSNPLLLSTLYEVKREVCEWEGLDTLQEHLIQKTLDPNDKTQIDPFVTVAKLTGISQRTQQRLIQKYRDHKVPQESVKESFVHQKKARKKIHIGYVSADLFDHPMMHLISGLFARHDRSRFDVSLFALYHDRESHYVKRVEAGTDRFIDLAGLSDEAAARKIYENDIDILIDLNGWTKNARTRIFAHRPAPVQIQYLGFAGTTACDFIDYVITDETVTPKEHAPFFSEKFLYMPDCYMVNDQEQAIDDYTPSRKECGLPDEAFVFASFNNAYKIEPVIFDVWMEILKSCEGSVLWLMAGNKEAEANLKNEAQKRGVNPERLVFAPKITKSVHLARLRNADLMLDTYFCNAHTTASDVLYAGLPMITSPGERFASRVAASTLHALGLDECSAADLEGYKKLAIRLASEEKRLKAIRIKLNENKKTTSLFDTGQFAKELEKGLTVVWNNYLKKRQPEMITIERGAI